MSSKGRVVIPVKVRERQNMRPGDELLIEERNDEIILKKIRTQRKKSMVQWMLDCPVTDFQLERTMDADRR